MTYRVAVDTGGTFTDLVAITEDTGEFRYTKASSTPGEPSSVLEALRKAGILPDEVKALVYGSTAALNALLERSGPRVGFLTNKGFRDLVFMQSGNRPDPYDLQWQKPKPFVLRNDCQEVDGRIDYRGRVVRPLNLQDLNEAIDYFEAEEIRSIAVCFLFSFVNPAHEQQAREAILARLPEATASLSHEVFPQWREYERASTTIADAYVKPLVARQVSGLGRLFANSQDKPNLLIMKSNGGVTSATLASQHALSTIKSGPVGGVLGAQFFARLLGMQRVLTMDMGGTSCDVSLLLNGNIVHTDEYLIYWGVPIKTPMLDVSSVGAGGGSIAWIDDGGLLQVGPRSAGGLPGPMCYGRGGTELTVTDANLILGYLGEDQLLGGEIAVQLEPTRAAFEDLGRRLGMSSVDTAMAVHDIANHNMVNALDEISIARGIDPAEFVLFGFGGAGPLHAASVARSLDISRVIIPPFPGVTSAFGLLTANLRVDRLRTVHYRSDQSGLSELRKMLVEELVDAVAELRQDGFDGEPLQTAALEMRYYGQNFGTDILVPTADPTDDDLMRAFENFHQAHEDAHGYRFPHEPVEVIGLKCTALGTILPPKPPQAPRPGAAPSPRAERTAYFEGQRHVKCSVFARDRLRSGFSADGPLLIEELGATTLVPPATRVTVDNYGCAHLELYDHQ